MNAEARFWIKVRKTDTCWFWTAGTTHDGYGLFWFDGQTVYSHRWAYEHQIGPIPAGLTLDHLCRNSNCVRPSHLEPVTMRENILRGNNLAAQNARKTHCSKYGHPLFGSNLYLAPDNKRYCRECHRIRYRRLSVARQVS